MHSDDGMGEAMARSMGSDAYTMARRHEEEIRLLKQQVKALSELVDAMAKNMRAA